MCPICKSQRGTTDVDMWFFVMTSNGGAMICSRKCLVKFVNALPEQEVPPIATLKNGLCKVVVPHRRE
jgi:hypothetical protein